MIQKKFNDKRSFDIENKVYEDLSKLEGYNDFFLAFNPTHTNQKEKTLCLDRGDIDLR